MESTAAAGVSYRSGFATIPFALSTQVLMPRGLQLPRSAVRVFLLLCVALLVPQVLHPAQEGGGSEAGAPEAAASEIGLAPQIGPVADPPPRPSLSLDGVWDFATDPDRVGEAEKWYLPSARFPPMPRPGYAPAANGKIRVPGVWDNQGYGTATEKVRHNFVGLGWYRREVEIPKEWAEAGRRLFLVAGGAHRYSKAWVNGKYLGEHVGYLSAFEHDVTDAVSPGEKATVVIQVDSRQRWEVDTMFGASDLADYMDVAWGGIWGHVSLEARSPIWLSDLFVRPLVSVSTEGGNSSCRVTGVLNGSAPAQAKVGADGPATPEGLAIPKPPAIPEAPPMPDAVRLEVFAPGGERAAEATIQRDAGWAPGRAIGITVEIPWAQLWSPESPALYTARLTLLRGGRATDAAQARFGMREFRMDGHRILLNGKRIFLHGYGDDHIYPDAMAMPSDKEVHLRRLLVIRSYGFNHVRHHSTILPPEYYDACDEVGILSTAEFPIAYSNFLPDGESRKRNVPPGTDVAPAVETYLREWAAAILRHRNHPSIFAWVMGNELWDGVPLRHDFARIARSLDPTRPFADSDGVTEMWGHILDPENDRDTLDVYFLMFDVGTNPLDNPTKFQTPLPKKPVVSHETGNYVTFSRPDLAEQFRHNVKPFWLTAGREKLEKLGLLAEAGLWAERSERLYIVCHKHNLEALRKNPFISGHHWWLFQDYWTSSNGLVDHYFRPKAISREEVLRIAGDVVLLQDGIDVTCRSGTRLQAKLRVSNFSPAAFREGRLSWRMELGGKQIGAADVPLVPVGQGDIAEVGDAAADLPEVDGPTGLVLEARIEVAGRAWDNAWSTRVYPSRTARPALPLPAYADGIPLERWRRLGIAAMPEGATLPAEAVYVADLLDRRLLDALERGARVLLAGPEPQILPWRAVTYRTTWWKAGDSPQANHCGTLVYDHPATRSMAPEGWCDAGWLHLLEGGRKYVLEEAPCRPCVIVRAIPSMALVEDAAILFEVGVGKGTLIVSGLNHERAEGRPEGEWIAARLLEHAASGQRPTESWPAASIRVPEAPPPGPHLRGFVRVVRNEGEEGVWHSWRADNVKVLVSRQTKPGNLVEWETAPVPAPAPAPVPGPVPAPGRGPGESSRDGEVTFVFSGGLGYSSEPRTEGFVLLVSGKETLRFDLADRHSWLASGDGKVKLLFVPRRFLPQDHLGLFYVTVSRDLLKAGEPCRLAVRSLGTGSRRWFGLNEHPEGAVAAAPEPSAAPGAARAPAAAPESLPPPKE